MARAAGGANKVRRLTLLEALDKSADSSATRDLITNANKYGLTKGSYRSEFLELTEAGRRAVDPDVPEAERIRSRFTLAIAGVEPSRILFERLVHERLPNAQVLRDLLLEAEIDPDFVPEAAELFVVNAKDLGVLRLISGAERLIPIEQVIEELPSQHSSPPTTGGGGEGSAVARTVSSGSGGTPAAVADTCFFIAPIGAEGSEERLHSDLVLAQIVEPAVSTVDAALTVVRADSIAEPGRITEQILRHIAQARLVVADLSFLNPNVFYELALRHAIGKPAVLVSRAADPIPFDVHDLRIVRMNMSDLYAFVPQMEAYRTELASHVRQALEHPAAVRTPVSEILNTDAT